MTKINFTQYKTKEDFLKDFPIIDGCLDLSNKQINDNDLIHILKLIGVEPRLKELSLFDNKLETLPVDIFNDLSSLERLYLGYNKLTDIPVGIFNGLSNLEWLFLSYNQLTDIPVNIFNGLSNLKVLSLFGNKLKTLPVGIFNGLSSLEWLFLYNNKIETIPVGIFNDLSSLERLSLQWNQLETLPVGIFNGLSRLKKLSLHSNKLKTLPVGVFNGLSNLKRLYLYNNKLETLPMSIKKSLPNDCEIHTDSNFKWVEDVIENKSGEQITQIQNWFIQNFKNEGVNHENVSEFMNTVTSMSDELWYIFKRKMNPNLILDSEGYHNGIKPIDGGFSIKPGTDFVIKASVHTSQNN